MKKRLRVGLAWQSVTSSNLGVSALGLSQIDIVKAAAEQAGCEVSFIEFCHTEQEPAKALAQGIELGDPLSPKRMLLGRTAINAQIAGCDVLLDIGEGDSFSDIYGGKRLALLTFLKWRALRLGVPLVISPQTIGPFAARWARAMAHPVIRGAERVFARDHLSMAYLQEQGLTERAQEVIDVAFRLPFERRAPAQDGRVHVGLNVSGLLFNGGYTGDNQFGLSLDYRALIERLGPALLQQPDVVLHLVGHVNSETFAAEDDYRVCEQLARAWGERAVLAPRFDTPVTAKTYISGLDFFTGARMHACIGAFSSGVPVIPMAYSRKFNGLFQSLGYTPLCDMKRHSIDEALAAVLDGFAQRDVLRAQVAEGNALAQRKLQGYEDYLTGLFRRLADAPSH